MQNEVGRLHNEIVHSISIMMGVGHRMGRR